VIERGVEVADLHNPMYAKKAPLTQMRTIGMRICPFRDIGWSPVKAAGFAPAGTGVISTTEMRQT
jgi:hypothetical protein